MAGLARKHNVSEWTMSRWRRCVGGLDVKEATWLKELERVNQQLICDFLMRHGSAADAAPYAERAGRQAERLEEAQAERSRIGTGDCYFAHGLPDDAVAQIGKQLGGHREVAAAYLARKAVEHAPERPLHVLGVVRRFGLYAEGSTKRLAEKLARELVLCGAPSRPASSSATAGPFVFPGEALVVVLTLGDWRLRKALRAVPDSEVFRR